MGNFQTFINDETFRKKFREFIAAPNANEQLPVSIESDVRQQKLYPFIEDKDEDDIYINLYQKHTKFFCTQFEKLFYQSLRVEYLNSYTSTTSINSRFEYKADHEYLRKHACDLNYKVLLAYHGNKNVFKLMSKTDLAQLPKSVYESMVISSMDNDKKGALLYIIEAKNKTAQQVEKEKKLIFNTILGNVADIHHKIKAKNNTKAREFIKMFYSAPDQDLNNLDTTKDEKRVKEFEE